MNRVIAVCVVVHRQSALLTRYALQRETNG
jgi:hypothetical protein